MDNLERTTWVKEIQKVIYCPTSVSQNPLEDSSNDVCRQLRTDLSEGNSFIVEMGENLSELRKMVSKIDMAANLVGTIESQLMSLNMIFLNLDKKFSQVSILTKEEDTESIEPEFFDCEEECLDNLSNNEENVDPIDEDFLYSSSGSNSSTNESIIKHLIRQVQIGMDLTRITLPTHILERRSFLEMLADFFSHCDLFSNITDFPDPRTRMVELVRAYLSCFHAGRDPDVAKKPYNPILGEIFRSYWKLGHDSDPELNSGPIPWAREGDMTLLAEQVSHHPPVSAFFAENKRKKFTFEGQIWTKSKFLGLSVGVNMTGNTVIRLGEHDETYTISFPSGFARSILTVPWFELGGKIQLSSNTGYSAQVEFHTKPTYKNTKNQITANIFSPGENSAFCTIKGAWNGLMTANFGGDVPQTFFDPSTYKIIKKVVKPVNSQEENESRRLWYNVTLCLFNDNVVGATGHKHQLEEKQRNEKKYRDENEIVYKPKYFELVGETWKYISNVD